MKFTDDNRIVIDNVPKNPKKMTGTRFASVLGLNSWSTPFEMWCAMTRTYEKPFEDTIYTIAGKTIEPKVIQYLKDHYFLDIKSPTEVYGVDYFKKTRGDFYRDVDIFGGMWDVKGEDLIVEIKTTKRAEDWLEDIPMYYKLQVALYAYLSKVDTVYVTCSFLSDTDYEFPEQFVPTAKNTIVRDFSMEKDFPDFEDRYIAPALKFWNEHVLTGISPQFDEKKDSEILKALRTNVLEDSAPVSTILEQIEADEEKIKAFSKDMEEIEARLKKNKEALKKYMTDKFRPNDTQVEQRGKRLIFTLSKVTKKAVDSNKLKSDGLYDKYTTVKTEYRLTSSEQKKEVK